MHAFYSEKQAEMCGVVVYARADGSLVECTCVSETSDCGVSWDDVKHLGEVTTFVSFDPQHQQMFDLIPIDWDDEEEIS